MGAKKDRVMLDTRLQITDTGKKRLRHMEHRPMLRAMMKQSPMGDAVFIILNRMDNGDIMTVGQLIDFWDTEVKLDYRMIITPMAIFGRKKASKAVSFWAINRCVKKGYLARPLALGN